MYGAAAKTWLKKLDVIQARALRICLGMVKTMPVWALQVEAGEMPLHIRRQQLMANYWVNLKGHNNNHPVKKVLENCCERE